MAIITGQAGRNLILFAFEVLHKCSTYYFLILTFGSKNRTPFRKQFDKKKWFEVRILTISLQMELIMLKFVWNHPK
jgi:hypothetical protein